MGTLKPKKTIEKWRLLNQNGNPIAWFYRIKSKGESKGYERFNSRQGRNRAIRIIRDDKTLNYDLVKVKDTKSRKL